VFPLFGKTKKNAENSFQDFKWKSGLSFLLIFLALRASTMNSRNFAGLIGTVSSHYFQLKNTIVSQIYLTSLFVLPLDTFRSDLAK